jgi:nucleoside-diphosphate-sugar epimerase
MRDTILLTGSTGVIGRALVPLLAERRDVEQIYALERGGSQSFSLENVTMVSGNITAGNHMGLSAHWLEEIAEKVTVIIHAAADTRFSAPLSQLRATNVDGTKNVLDFASRCRRLRGIVCLSTVHVAGKRTGVIEEEIVEYAAGFVNDYEQSKYEAELLLRHKMQDLPICVVRLSTVLGDTRTGEVSKLAAIHQGLRLYYHSLAPMIPGFPSSPVDLIALDYASTAIAHLAISNFSAASVFHLCGGRDTLSLEDLLKMTHEAFMLYRPAWRKRSIASPTIVDLATFELFARSVDEVGDNLLRHSVNVIRHFAPQLAYPKTYEDVSCRRALDGIGVNKPRVADFYPQVVRWLVESGWTDQQFTTPVEAVAS